MTPRSEHFSHRTIALAGASLPPLPPAEPELPAWFPAGCRAQARLAAPAERPRPVASPTATIPAEALPKHPADRLVEAALAALTDQRPPVATRTPTVPLGAPPRQQLPPQQAKLAPPEEMRLTRQARTAEILPRCGESIARSRPPRACRVRGPRRRRQAPPRDRSAHRSWRHAGFLEQAAMLPERN